MESSFMGSKRLTPTIVGKMALKRLSLLLGSLEAESRGFLLSVADLNQLLIALQSSLVKSESSTDPGLRGMFE